MSHRENSSSACEKARAQAWTKTRRFPSAPSLRCPVGMYIRLPIVFAAAILVGGCHGSGTRGTETTPPGDMAVLGGGGGDGLPPGGHAGGDMAPPGAGDDHSDGGGTGSLGDGGVFNPGPSDMGSVMHAPPGTLTGVAVYGAGTDFRDVSTDEGHGVWATTSSTVYY